ncbi:MAG: hypothetical protein ACFE8B_11690 [Candidatus Hermodarchaeota archaeon]
MKKNVTGLVIAAVIFGVTLTSVSVTILQTESEDQKEEIEPGKEEEKDDKTPPVITIDYLPIGDGTDENPGAWDVFAYDKESGINYDSINVYIDDILIGNSLGTYDVPCTLGDHSILVEVMNNNTKKPLLGTSSDIISIIDDDITPPELSNLIIEANFEYVIISLSAIDYSGIGGFNILINEELITPLKIEEHNSNFILVLKNQWIFECSTNNVEIQAIDADNDREDDALSSSIYGTFEISIDDMYQFVICKIEELKSYITSNIESHFKYCLNYKLSLVQDSLVDALYYFKEGKVMKGLGHDLKALFFLRITEKAVEKRIKLYYDNVKFIIDELHTIRNSIHILIGASLESELVNDIVYIQINLLNSMDYIKENTEGCSIWCLQNLIRFSYSKLNWAVMFLVKEKNPNHMLDCAQIKLQRAICKVNFLLKKDVISQEIGNNVKSTLLQSIEDIEIIKTLFC